LGSMLQKDGDIDEEVLVIELKPAG
jgi:hypothetical protein